MGQPANRLNQTVTAGSGYSNTLGFANPGGAQTNHPDGMCFDSSGNMTAESGTCPPASPMYSYDAENRMTAYSGTSAASYVYDDNGNRVKKCLPNCTSPTTTTVYVFSAGQDVAEYDNGAAPASPSREYIYSGGQLITTLAGSTTTYHHADHLSVRLSTDTNGNKIGEQGHYPYGESWYSNNTTTKFVFTGYERDSESSNDYAMARYYRVGFGRFCSPDPLGGNVGDPQSWNRYVYARDNPISNVDPSGMSWLSGFIHALISFFTDVNLGPGGTPPTFPTGNYDVWQKLEDAIAPMGAGGTPPIFGLASTAVDQESAWEQGITDCAKQDFGVTMTSFTPSTKGHNGKFVGTGPDVNNGGKDTDITVVNDVNEYTGAEIKKMLNTNNDAEGLEGSGGFTRPIWHFPPTRYLTPYTNYSASDVDGWLTTRADQAHELAHSLADITGAKVPADKPREGTSAGEDVGDWFTGCVESKYASIMRGH